MEINLKEFRNSLEIVVMSFYFYLSYFITTAFGILISEGGGTHQAMCYTLRRARARFGLFGHLRAAKAAGLSDAQVEALRLAQLRKARPHYSRRF